MSFTQAEHLFAGVNELGFNELLRAFFNARPRHLHHVTPPFVTAGNSQSVTVHPTLYVFGIPVNYELHFTIPAVDINPDGGALTAPGEFTVLTQVSGNASSPLFGSLPIPIPSVQMLGVCEPVVTVSQPGTGIIGINVKSVTLTPPLPGLQNAGLVAVLQAVLGDVKIPYNTLTVGAFGLILLVGPKSENNQIEVRGNAL
ncbi:MAG TPA: hypothetical protein VF591_17210 [Pyrinomonadaceae bacterium]|jgi:hypothetical protein